MITQAAVLEATLRSLGIALLVALLAGLAGVMMAWFVARTDFPGRRVLGGFLSVPYAIPAYLLGMAWVVLGNPTVGLLRDWLPATGSYGFWGIVLVESTVAFAFPYLEVRAGFDRMDPSLEEAARMSGAGPVRVFRDVSLPLLWPAMFNGMALAFLYALASFGVPAILGLPVRQFTLTTLIYSQFKLGGESGLANGLWLSSLLLGIAALALIASAWLSRLQRRKGGAISGAKASRPSLVKLGPARLPVALGSWLFFFVAVVLPWLALGMSALAPVAGKYSPSLWTLKNLRYVLELADFHEALFNSALLACGMASLVVVVGFLLAYAAVRGHSHRASALIEALGLPFATPGTVLALALVFGAASLSRLGIPLDIPLLMMAFAYALKYGAVGARSMVSAVRQVHPALEEAARVSGATHTELLWTIWVPLVKKSLVATWLLAMLPMLTELTMSVLLTGPGAATLGTVLFQLQEYADQPSAAAMAWMLLTIALFVAWFTRRKDEE